MSLVSELRRFMMRYKRSELIIIILLFLIHVLMVWLYRPYVYANCTETAGLAFMVANNYPSFSAVLLGYFTYRPHFVEICDASEAKSKYILLGCMVVGNYIYEGLNMLLGGGDWFDMIAITLGGVVVAMFIYIAESIKKRPMRSR